MRNRAIIHPKTRLASLAIGVLTGLLLLGSPERSLGQPTESGRNSVQKTSAPKAIALSFRPVAVEDLTVGKPKSHWIKAKTVQFWSVPKTQQGERRQQPATIHLFLDPGDKGVASGDVYAFLEDHEVFYELGNFSYGVADVRVDASDLTNAGTRELVLTGGLGAACNYTEILGFNEKKGKWVRLLAIYGIAEQTATYGGAWVIFEQSPGMLPPWMNIYRWSEGHFEQAEVVRATGDNSAEFVPERGVIKTETYDALGKVVATHYWRYEEGKLIRVGSKDRNFLFRRDLFAH